MLTLNVCFENDETFGIRFGKLVKFLLEKEYDVVALQECVSELMQLLDQRLSAKYDISPRPSEPYFTTMLCKKEFRTSFVRTALPSDMGRDLLYADLTRSGGAVLTCATVHLESLEDHSRREVQLHGVNRLLREKKNVILVGDFNFPAHRNYKIKPGERLQNESLRQCLPGFTDMWEQLNPGSPGYTINHARNQWKFSNKLLAKGGFRFDRVMAKIQAPSEGETTTTRFKVSNVCLVGEESIAESPATSHRPECSMYMSDHLGLEITVSDSEPEPKDVPLLSSSSSSASSSSSSAKRVRQEDSERKALLIALLGEEPGPSSPNHVKLGLILSNGQRISRRFPSAAPAEALFWWAQVEDSRLQDHHHLFELKSCGGLSPSALGTSANPNEDQLDTVPEINNSLFRVVIV